MKPGARSPEALTASFAEAVKNDDYKSIVALLDNKGEKVSENEAKAFTSALCTNAYGIHAG